MKNVDIFILYDSLDNLSRSKDIILPAKIGYICIKNKNLLEPYYNAIGDSRANIINQYAVIDEDGKLKVPEDKINEANEKLQEILDMEENDINIQKININNIQESLPMDILTGLMPMLMEEED